LHRYKTWERKTEKLFWTQFLGFLNGKQKIEDWKKHGEGASPKSFPKTLGKDFFLPRRQHYGDLPPQTHPNESQSSVHALSNLQS